MLNDLESNLTPLIAKSSARMVRRLLLIGWYHDTPIEETLDQIMTALSQSTFNQKSRG